MVQRVLRLAAGGFAVLCLLGFSRTVASRAPGGAAPQPVLGELQQYRLQERDSLIELARRFDVGFNAISAANPGIDPFAPPPGLSVTIPTAWILPDVALTSGIVVNLPEFRLYYVPPKSSARVLTFPLGIGDEGANTPEGSYSVVQKIVAPAWHVPASIRAERRGLPAVVPPGPDNPLGSHALRLSRNAILIHGTDRPFGIGRRSSHGCLRLYPEDIVRLFAAVPAGTRVEIVSQPIKVGAKGNKVYLEAHGKPYQEGGANRALHLLARKQLLVYVDFAKVTRAIEERKGVPVDVSSAEGELPWAETGN